MNAYPQTSGWVWALLVGMVAVWGSYRMFSGTSSRARARGDALLCGALRDGSTPLTASILHRVEERYLRSTAGGGLAPDPLPAAVIMSLIQALRDPAEPLITPLSPEPSNPATLLAGCLVEGSPAHCRDRIESVLPPTPARAALRLLDEWTAAGCFAPGAPHDPGAAGSGSKT